MPAWLDDAIFYEIYPQTFFDTNSDGIGDLPGIIEKLDYIAQLGFSALWLNPCFDSPFHDAGYDVRDYKRIAPRYGTNADMRRLFEEAHKRNLRVLLDLVAGHTSIEHEWFLRAMQSDPEYAGRYIFAEDAMEHFEDVEGVLGYINGICERGSCAANFYSTQPALNYGFARTDKPWQTPLAHPDAQATVNAMQDVMRFWLQMGADGFRVDMAGSLIKNDAGQEETIRLWQRFRRFLDAEFPDAVIVSEWGDPARALRAGFHMDFLLHFGPSHYLDLFQENPFFSKTGSGDLSRFLETYQATLREVGGSGLVCIPSSNHDMPRIARHLDTAELKLAFAFLFSVPGAPFVYYGDEIGMRYLEGLPSVEGAFARTGSRTPMQWDATLNAGFSSAKPEELYTPLDPDPNRPTVAAQQAAEGSLLREIQAQIALRRAHPALQNRAPITFYPYRPGAPLFYRRGEGERAVYVALNPSAKEATVALPAGSATTPIYRVGGQAVVAGNSLVLPPCSGVFLSGD